MLRFRISESICAWAEQLKLLEGPSAVARARVEGLAGLPALGRYNAATDGGRLDGAERGAAPRN